MFFLQMFFCTCIHYNGCCRQASTNSHLNYPYTLSRSDACVGVHSVKSKKHHLGPIYYLVLIIIINGDVIEAVL